MHINNCEINILIKDRKITEFFHRGQTFIEGRAGSNYEIEFRNNNPFRVEAILSVDGLSVIDGKDAGPNSAGYVVNAYGVIRIPGWKLDDTQVAAFAFSGEQGGSYVEQMTGSGANKGVIGALVYKEKQSQYAYAPKGGSVYRSIAYQDIQCSATASIQSGWPLNNAGNNSVFVNSAMPVGDVVQQNLGTAFGEATAFQTTTISFERGDLAAMLILYYDNLDGLRKRGIVIPRRETIPVQPQAFPGMTVGCEPPKNWKGNR